MLGEHRRGTVHVHSLIMVAKDLKKINNKQKLHSSLLTRGKRAISTDKAAYLCDCATQALTSALAW